MSTKSDIPKPKKLKRPKVTYGTITRIETGCGHLYVTVGRMVDEETRIQVENILENGLIIEAFATLGKSGGCAKAQGEAITRSLSLGLKYGIPVEEFIKEFDNIRCPSPGTENGVQVLSCADAIAKVLKKEIEKNEPNTRATAE